MTINESLLLALVLLSVIISNANAAGDQCICDYSSTRRRLSYEKSRRSVTFTSADGLPPHATGEKFKRTTQPSTRYISPSPIEQGTFCLSEQVHITLGDKKGDVIVSFATKDFNTVSTVEVSTNADDLKSNSGKNIVTFYGNAITYSEQLSVNYQSYNPTMGKPLLNVSQIMYIQNTSRWAINKTSGEKWANYYEYPTVKTGLVEYNNPYNYYDSPMIHTVTLTALEQGRTYYYRVSGSCLISKFVIPVSGNDASIYPQTIGLTGDTGQTWVSDATFNALRHLNASFIMLVGDLSYADGWPALWDSFGNLIQNLASNVPLLTAGGNHEVGSSEAWQSYKHRYPTPHKGANSPNFGYWGKEIGAVHLITLNSYAGSSNTSLQYQWLVQYLETSINRARTPWVIVQVHTPLYNSNNGHWMEGELMRLSIEPLLYSYGVDVVLSGHVHSYERTAPVYNNIPTTCGTVHLVIGDGGNYEGAVRMIPRSYIFYRAEYIVNSFS